MLRKSLKCQGPTQCKSGPGNSMNSRRNHVPFFSDNSLPPRQFLRDEILFKKHYVGEMLIEQIIDFELRGPGPPGRTCTPTAGYFHDKAKISEENFRVDYYLLVEYCRRQCTLLLPTWAKSLINFNLKMQDFKRVLDLNGKN